MTLHLLRKSSSNAQKAEHKLDGLVGIANLFSLKCRKNKDDQDKLTSELKEEEEKKQKKEEERKEEKKEEENKGYE